MTTNAAPTPTTIASLLDVLSVGAVLVDQNGTVQSCNNQFAKLIGYSQDEIEGKPFAEIFVVEEDAVSHSDADEKIEATLKCCDNQEHPVVIASRPLPANWELPGYRLYNIVDISKQKAAEQQIRDQYEAVVRVSDGLLGSAITFRSEKHELTDKLAAANLDAVHMLAVASELKDADTGMHIRRIQYGTELLARAIGISPDDAKEMGVAAVLHDVGKLLVPDEVLKKPSELTIEERHTIELHTVVGENLMPDKPFFRIARKIARSHHENWDGSGYPDGTAGEMIPLPARIVRVIDVYDALTNDRVYKDAQPAEDAIAEMTKNAGVQFDPTLIETLARLQSSGALATLQREIAAAAEADDWTLVDVERHLRQ